MSTVNGAWRGPNIVKDGLILYLDSASPNSYYTATDVVTWKDISGYGNNGTLINGPIYNSVSGGVITFDGANDYVNCGSSSILNSPDNASVSIWFSPTILPTGSNFESLFAKRISTAPNTTNYGINYNNSVFQWYYNSTGTYRTTAITTSTYFTANRWYNVGAIFQKSGTNTNASIYVNGTLAGSGTTLENIVSSSAPVLVGSTTPTIEYFRGSVAILQIYNRALTQTEIIQNFNAQRSRFNL